MNFCFLSITAFFCFFHCVSHECQSTAMQSNQPSCVALQRATVVSAASVCRCVLSIGGVLCHAAVSGAGALSYCLLPYGSQNQHEDKPVLMLFSDLLRHPAGTKCRNNYSPNYPGQLCLVFVCCGVKEGSSEVLGELLWREVPNKRPQRGWSHAAS